MMEVTNTKPFDVIFTFVKHPYFGMLVEANAVQLLPNGEYSLTFQRIREKNSSYFKLNPEQAEAVKMIEEFEAEAIMKRFYKGSKRIRPAEFFLKHYDEETHKKVRDLIEKRLVKVLELIRNYPLFLSGKAGDVAYSRISYSEEPASVLFHFRRDENGTNYFATIKQQGEKVEFYHNNSEILCSKPAWLLTPKGLYHFGKFVDGKKISPFLSKKYIHVEPRSEDVYMEKFVKPLLENHDVYAVGFDIITEQFQANPILRLMKGFDTSLYAGLYFKYGNWSFPYHVNKRVNVSLDKRSGQYLFHRIRRSFNWEGEKISVLKEMGLVNAEGSLFELAGAEQGYELIEWLNANAEALRRNGFVVEQEQGVVTYYLGDVSLDVQVKKDNDWFDVKAMVRFGHFVIPFVKLRKHILDKKREFLLPDGSVAILPEEWFSRFGKIAHLAEVEGDHFRLRNMHFSLLDDLSEYVKEEIKVSENWGGLLTNGAIPEFELPDGLKADFRTYQHEGYNWMRFLMDHNIGALLADDMGLGKTLQTLAVLQHLTLERRRLIRENLASGRRKNEMVAMPALAGDSQLNLFGGGDVLAPATLEDEGGLLHKIPGPCLVIAPKSLLYNWQAEAKKFAPGMHTFIYGGMLRQRQLPHLADADIVITSYGTMRNDAEELARMDFNCIVLDESQAIKNPASQTARNLHKINSNYRIALTGTPIENTLLDVWSQMNFLNPGLLGSYHYFEKQFIKPIEKNTDQKRSAELKKILDPFVLRRTKKQVASELPEKVEKIHYCEMSEEQAALYEKVKSQYRNEILEHVQQMGIARSRLKIFNGLMHLRQLALNPVLKDEDYAGKSGKDDEIHHALRRALDGGHKVLLFSQFVSYLKVHQEMLESEGIKFCYLDGSMDSKQRAHEIQVFQTDPEVKVFLLSLRAGNSGINLTAADYVFLADPWWNPFTMKQAEDRAHRIGQDKTVFSYKFITKNTIEEKILKLQQKKTELAESIIPDEDTVLTSLNVQELEELLS